MSVFKFYDAVPGIKNVRKETGWLQKDFHTKVKLHRKGRPNLYFIYVKER